MNGEIKRKIVIWGCGGHSRSVADVILFNEPAAILVFIDDFARRDEEIFGFPVVKNFPAEPYHCFLAIGDNARRKKRFDLVGRSNLISVVSDNAYIGRNCKIDIGCFVAHSCHIGPEAIIGKNTILNTASVVEHEAVIGQHCHIGPNATVSGRTKIGDLVFVGVGATVIDNVNICSNTVIGAGATVTKDIIVPGVYIGTPARRSR